MDANTIIVLSFKYCCTMMCAYGVLYLLRGLVEPPERFAPVEPPQEGAEGGQQEVVVT